MKKLKSQFKYTKKSTFFGSTHSYFYRLRSHTHKAFSTLQEKSYYSLHRYEYEAYGLKLRAARGKLLPDSWEDLPARIYDVAKSWKHNSKRRHQYYR
ncbi:hypothetical protein CYR32_08795 [Chimaeribacter coloradensis]|uniref:Uncharacterized protein n=1 Tax=Chimaeribacter coloradensis TaxID=2060068 RepID=A0A2N5E5L4_9GAMM|nr:hypothetical protein [Chimaeribacter coloradensis]PLR36447.1 hypothetical protein CYR32_08795 [Chimaeribacter coloradensis]